ncbi:hypothetical protein AX16_006242 [Volvariella volvacea WC 439]|nr:hypothetical protein AX16_006242 [Volvariella volvacea WC 439]
MSKSSTASAPKTLPKQSAWSKGPPQTTIAPSSRSQSPAPSTPTYATHSRRSSTLGQGVAIKDGVSVPRNNIGSVKQGSSPVTFGSIDDTSNSAPISSSPAAAPTVKTEVKSFGSVPAVPVNGKSAVQTRQQLAPPTPTTTTISSTTTSSSTASTPPVSTPSTPAPKPHLGRADISKFFQNPSSAPPSHPSSDTSSPAQRTTSLPPAQPPASQPPPAQPPQLSAHFTPYVPSSMRPSQPPGNVPPRSPSYPRAMVNGAPSRSQPGPNGTPAQVNAALGSPRLAPGPHPGQPSPMPPPPAPMQGAMPPAPAMWGQYYYTDQGYVYPQWYPPPPQPQHPPPGAPHTLPHAMPMSPRTQAPALPGTPTQSHAQAHIPHMPHPPHPHGPPSSMSSITSPPPTPSTATVPQSRLNASSSTFVPSSAPRKPITLKNPDGAEVSVEALGRNATAANSFRPGSANQANRRSANIRLESEEQKKLRLAEEEAKEKARQDAEEKAKREKEKERAEREEAERKRKAEEEEKEKERLRQEAEEKRLKEEAEEKEKQRKEEERKLREAEEERKRKEKEELERKQKEEEERQRQAEEAAAKEAERLRLEAEAKAKAEEERKRAAEQAAAEEAARAKAEAEAEAAAKAKAEEEAAKQAEEDREEGEILETREERDAAEVTPRDEIKEKMKESLRINTSLESRKRPNALDLSLAKGPVSAPLGSALLTARHIGDINSVPYPEGVSSPNPDLNKNASEGRFRYDRDFLLQFMSICKERPPSLPALDAIGLEPNDPSTLPMTRPPSGRRPPPGTASRQPSVGLGFGPGFKAQGNPFGGMGSFSTGKTSEERFHASTAGRSPSVSGGTLPFARPSPMQRTPSTGGVGGPPMGSNGRTRSKRGEKRSDLNKVTQPSHGSSFPGTPSQQTVPLEPVAPLQFTANRWDRKHFQGGDTDSPEMVERKVKSLLNKLTMEKFESISDQIIEWANKSEKENDGRTLIQVIKLVFEKATDEATWSEMYARLCRKMMEQISNKVQDDGIKNADGKPITGGNLFRKYLLNRCQEDFERGWVAKEATAAAAASKAAQDQAAKAANDKKEGGEEIALYSDEYYAAQRAKRQGLGLIKFIGELFKLSMLTERIMHECIKKLLGNVDDPEEEEIESLCKLLTTVGHLLDTPKAKQHMDVYFSRMKDLNKNPNISNRMQFMLQDVIDLRDRKWVARNAVAAPTTIAAVHEQAAKEKANLENQNLQRLSMSRGGSRRGVERAEVPQVPGSEGWSVAGSGAPRAPAKAGDLSNFGKISKSTPMTFGPTSVFSAKKDNKRDTISRTNSSSNMFSMLSQAEMPSEPKAEAVPVQRRKIILQPRTKPVEEPSATPARSESPVESSAAPTMTEEAAKKKIDEDIKEFFSIRSLDEAEDYFTSLPPAHHALLVEKLVGHALESKEADAKLVSSLFEVAAKKDLCGADAFEAGFTPLAEIIDDIVIDAPKALDFFAVMIKGATLDQERQAKLANFSIDSDKLLGLLS